MRHFLAIVLLEKVICKEAEEEPCQEFGAQKEESRVRSSVEFMMEYSYCFPPCFLPTFLKLVLPHFHNQNFEESKTVFRKYRKRF